MYTLPVLQDPAEVFGEAGVPLVYTLSHTTQAVLIKQFSWHRQMAQLAHIALGLQSPACLCLLGLHTADLDKQTMTFFM